MRAFTCINLPMDISGRIAQLQAQIPKLNVSMVSCENMHITLHFFKDISDAESLVIIGAIKSEQKGSFWVDVAGVSSFNGIRGSVIFAEVADSDNKIAQIYNRIADSISASGIRTDQKDTYIPHITIARCRAGYQWLGKFIEEHKNITLGRLEVKTILFKKSMLYEQGPVHTTLFEQNI